MLTCAAMYYCIVYLTNFFFSKLKIYRIFSSSVLLFVSLSKIWFEMFRVLFSSL